MISREEGGDDVKSSWPLRAGLHTCYNGGDRGTQRGNSSQISKSRLSSDWALQLEPMKLESLVIVDQHATVNTGFPLEDRGVVCTRPGNVFTAAC